MKNLSHLLYPAANASTVRPKLLACVLLVAALIGATSQALSAAAGSLVPSAPKGKQTEAAAKTLLKLPLRFEGTADRQAMVVHLGDRRLLLKKAGSVELKSGTGPALSIELEGANRQSFPVGQDRLPGKSNYFLGNDPSRWRKGVQQFSQARLKDVYNGVDLLYYGNGTELEHDYILAPGRDPSAIRMRVSGGKTAIDPKTGDLIVSQSDTSDELIRLVRPVAYQKAADGSRKDVAAQYARNKNGSFGFALGTYDHTLPLTIDPVLNYSTYFGGNNEDRIVDIKTNLAGDIYLLVRTLSTDLPVPSQIPGACNDVCGPANSSPFPTYYSPSPYDMYIAKLDNTGQKLIFSSYIGGTGQDFPSSLALAPDGTICIAGLTDSQDFPVFNGYASTFPLRLNLTSTLTRLSANGSDILYSTFIGSDNSVNVLPFYANFTAPYTVAAGQDGIAYLLGGADTTDGNPGTFLDAKNSTFTQGGGSFIAKFDTTKTGYDSLVYAKVFGQPGDQSSYVLDSIAIDSKQDVWAFGLGAYNAPVTADAIQSVCDGGPKCHNGYLFALDQPEKMVYGTFVGGTPNASGVPQNETPEAMVIDASDNVYISGLTDSQGMPVVNGVYSFTPLNLYSSLGGFLIKLSPGGKSILYSTYTGFDPAVMSAGAGGLVTANSIEGEIHQTNPLGDAIELETNDAFVAFDTTKSGLPSIVSLSHLAPADYGYVLTPLASAIDAQGNMLVVGFTSDPVLPLVKPFQSTCAMCGSVVEGFVERVQLVDGPPVIGALTLTPTSQSFPNTTVGSASSTLSSTLTNATDSAISLSYGTLSDISDFSVAGNCPAIILSSTSCTLNFTFKPQSAGALSATYSIYDLSNASSPLNVALTGTGTAPATPKASLTHAALTFGSVAIAHTGTAQTVTLANPGGAALAITSVGLSGTNAGDFSIATNTCGTSLAAGASCAVTVNFTPTATGTRAATLSVVDKVGTQTASLTGTGIVHPIAIAPASFDFGQVTVGDYKTQAFTLTNVSSAPADIDLPSITESGISFEFSSSVICGTIAPGGSCTIQVKFSPTATGIYSASLNVTDSGGTQTVGIHGKAVSPPNPGTLTPTTLNFGNITVGSTSGLEIAELTNTGTAPFTIASITASDPVASGGKPGQGGTNDPGILVRTSFCSTAVTPGNYCKLEVTLAPAKVGPYSGTVVIKYYLGDGLLPSENFTATLNIIGNGVVAGVTVTPGSADFGSITEGQTSSPKIFTVTNNTSSAVTLTRITTGSPSFLLASGATCIIDGQLAAEQSCTIPVAFLPTSDGTNLGALDVSYVDASSRTVLETSPLTGIGIGLAFTPANTDFGDVALYYVNDFNNGLFYSNRTITVTNVSTAPIKLNSGAFYLRNTPPFYLYLNDNFSTCSEDQLLPGQSCAISISFEPFSGVGASYGGLFLGYSDASGEALTATSSLTGTAVPSLFSFTPAYLPIFPLTCYANCPDIIGETFQTLTLTNTSPSPINISSVTTNDPTNFALGCSYAGDYVPACGSSTVPPGGSVKITVYFNPNSAGFLFQALIIDTDAGPFEFTLAGAGFDYLNPNLTFTPGQGFSLDSLALNGPTTVADGALQLTSGPSSAASSAFYPTPLPTKSFNTDFTFQLLDPTAEGITFTIQGDGPNAVGQGGVGLGYQGLAKSIAVKFDLKDTAGEGVDSTGIYVKGAAPTVPAISLASSGIDLHSGHLFDLSLSYDGTTMTVTLTDITTRAVWTTKVAEDIPAIVGGNTAYFGFTAGSGTTTLNSNAAAEKPALAARPATAAATAAPATSKILSWGYAANGETKTTQTISFPSMSAKTYGAAPVTLTAKVSSGLPVSYSVAGPAKLSGSTLTITGAGEVTVTASQAGNASFASATPVTRSFAVAKAPLTVIANSLSRAFGAANPAFTYELSGFVNGDTASVVSGTATLATTTSVTSPSGSYPITFSTEGLTAANYSFNYLAGTLTVTPGTLVIAPASGNFGSVKVGTTSPVISFTVTNDTASTMGYLGYANLGEFYLQPGTCHLVNGEPMLNPGKSCVFTAVFKPTKAGPVSGNLSIQTSSGTFNIPMSGTGATLVISPASGNFGSVKIGQTSPVMSFTVTNDTASTMGYLGYANLGEFYLQPGTCHLVNGEPMLNPGKSCVFTAVFKPTKAGAASGNMSIQTSSGTFNVPMSGTGATP